MKEKDWQLLEKKVASGLKIAGELAATIIHLRNKPRALDWACVGVALAGTALHAREDWRKFSVKNPWNYFGHDVLNSVNGKWAQFPSALKSLAIGTAKGIELLEANEDISAHGVITLATLAGERVGWIGNKDHGGSISPVFYLRERKQETYDAFGHAIWDKLGTKHAEFTLKGIVDEEVIEEDVIETPFIKELTARVQLFMDAGKSRGYLLEGIPGTGKSTAIQHITFKLGLRSLRVDLRTLDTGNELRSASEGWEDDVSLDALIKIIKPDIVIIDDIDRVPIPEQGWLLNALERYHRSCKVIMASANCRKRVTPALRRPKRFDEHYELLELDDETLNKLLGPEDVELVERMRSWPIAFVAEYVERRDVLGRDQAQKEIEGLQKRVNEAKEEKDFAMYPVRQTDGPWVSAQGVG